MMAKMVSRKPPMAGSFLAPLADNAWHVLGAEYAHFTAIAGFACCRDESQTELKCALQTCYALELSCIGQIIQEKAITELCRLVDIFDGVKLCIGNPDNIIVQLYHNNTYTLHSYSGHQAGYIDTALLNHSETVRYSCTTTTHIRYTVIQCRALFCLFNLSVYPAYSEVEESKFIQLPDLVARLGNIRASYRSLLKQLDRLRSRIHQDTEVKGVFLDEECNAYIKDIICLPESAKHLESLPEDSFEHIFWQQQIETASQNSSWHMRWHPLMIRFCLSLRHKSGGAYELLRQSGCIKLPSQRTLQDYTHYVQSCLESALTDGNTASSQAKTMFVLMIRGLFTKLQFPYAQFLCCALKGDQLYDYFWEAVGRVVNCGLKVLSESVSKALVLVCGDECNETSQFVEMMDKFLDALNVHNYSHGSRALKPFQLPYTSREDPRLRYVGNLIFRQLVRDEYSFSLECSNLGTTEQLTYEELNALRYTAGYVPRALQKKLSKHPRQKDLQLYLNELISDGSEAVTDFSDDWLTAVNRGGLIVVKNMAFELFHTMECEFRQNIQPTGIADNAVELILMVLVPR
eukprot:Em0002g602a